MVGRCIMDAVEPVTQPLLADAALHGHPHAVPPLCKLGELLLQPPQILERLAELIQALDPHGRVGRQAGSRGKEGGQCLFEVGTDLGAPRKLTGHPVENPR